MNAFFSVPFQALNGKTGPRQTQSLLEAPGPHSGGCFPKRCTARDKAERSSQEVVQRKDSGKQVEEKTYFSAGLEKGRCSV